MRPKTRAAALSAGALCIALSATACAGAGGAGAGDQNSINVLMVNNPQMEDLQRLTADNSIRPTSFPRTRPPSPGPTASSTANPSTVNLLS